MDLRIEYDDGWDGLVLRDLVAAAGAGYLWAVAWQQADGTWLVCWRTLDNTWEVPDEQAARVELGMLASWVLTEQPEVTW